jgi:hypothetical protein
MSETFLLIFLCNFQAIEDKRLFIGLSENFRWYLFEIRLADLPDCRISCFIYLKNRLYDIRLSVEIHAVCYPGQRHGDQKINLN